MLTFFRSSVAKIGFAQAPARIKLGLMRPGASSSILRAYYSDKSSSGSATTIKGIEEQINDIDLNLTPEQRERVDGLKKSFHGKGRSLYWNVPTVEELEKLNSGMTYTTHVPSNAEALIDWALTHIPERGGYRGSRRKGRMSRKWKQKRENDRKMKAGKLAGMERRQAKAKRQRELVAHYKSLAAQMAEGATVDAKLNSYIPPGEN
jgi:hypothetical protein